VGIFMEQRLLGNGHGQEIGGAALRRRAGRMTSGAAVGVPALERSALKLSGRRLKAKGEQVPLIDKPGAWT
jgi:hypothetical protein